MTGAGAVTITTGAGAGAVARGRHAEQHRVQQTRTSRIKARTIAVMQPRRIQPAVVGSLPQKKVALHASLPAAGPGAGARDESLCAAQKVPPDAVASAAAVAQPASQTHLRSYGEGLPSGCRIRGRPRGRPSSSHTLHD